MPQPSLSPRSRTVVVRILNPVAISLNEAIFIAVLGLAVNLLCACLLREDHDHLHSHEHHHDHHRRHQDQNLRSAYVYVLADALTSVLAIIALLAAGLFGWTWMDPAVGIIGACVIAAWSLSLIRSSSAVLLDMVPDSHLYSLVRNRLEIQGDKVSDLHLWRVGPGHTALIASVITDCPQPTAAYKARLEDVPTLSHLTFEIHACTGQRQVPAAA